MNKKIQPIRLHPHWKQFIATEGLIIPIPVSYTHLTLPTKGEV